MRRNGVPSPPLRHVVFFDKPAGVTSHDAVQMVKGICRAGRAGHSGTLDPAVTGLLVVALDEARKAMPVLVGLDKEYEGTLHLHEDCTAADLEAAFGAFTGTIVQTPPARSRVKRVPRERTVHELELSAVDGRDVRFHVRCQAGTYIRTLAVDVGEYIGCGAHLTELRRTRVGPWSEMADRDRLALDPAARMVRIETALEDLALKKVCVTDAGSLKTMQGKLIEAADVERADEAAAQETVGIFHQGRLIALATTQGDCVKPHRIFH